MRDPSSAGARIATGITNRLRVCGNQCHASTKIDWPLIAILSVGFLVRLGVILTFPSLHHPDENFQLFEQGHRWFFGTGLVPWEFQLGTRSPVMPFLLGLTFRLVEPIVGGPQGYILVARLLLAATSMAAVAAVYLMAKRTSATHGVLAGLVTAVYFELVYFAGRPLTEAVATTVLLIALSLASISQKHFHRTRVILVGFFLVLCMLLRVHLVFGLVLIAGWVGRLNLTRWWWMALGSLPPLIVFAIADTIVWGGFFHSYIETMRLNLLEGVASRFGVAPMDWYLYQLVDRWSYALPIFILLIMLRARSSMLWILVAIAILLTHSLIPHKEYRFIFPANACLVVVAAMGTADLIERMRTTLPQGARLATMGAAVLWMVTSLTLATTSKYSKEWYRGHDFIEAEFLLARTSGLCGILLYDFAWWDTGGYAHLHRDVPFYVTHERGVEKLAMLASAFDVVLLKRSSIVDLPRDYTAVQCWGRDKPKDLCVMRRDGVCTRVPGLEPLQKTKLPFG